MTAQNHAHHEETSDRSWTRLMSRDERSDMVDCWENTKVLDEQEESQANQLTLNDIEAVGLYHSLAKLPIALRRRRSIQHSQSIHLKPDNHR